MIKEDFTDLHNHSSEALTAAWKLGWSLIIGILHYLCICSIWMRNLAEPEAPPAWVHLALYEPVKLKYEQGPTGIHISMPIRGNEMLKEEIILSDLESFKGHNYSIIEIDGKVINA